MNLNNNYLYIRTDKQIRYFDLSKDEFNEKDIKYINFYISPDEKYSKIINIISSGDTNIVVIIVDNTLEHDTIFIWDMRFNVEKDSYDVGKEYEIIFDSKGELIIMKKNYCLYRGAKIKAFDTNRHIIEPINNLRRYKGHRFDAKNHNWIILKEYIMLPFSYLAFVLKDKIEKNFNI